MGDIIPYSANPPQKSPALPARLGCGLNPVVLIQPGRCAPAGLGITRRSSNNELGGDGPGLVHRYDALLGKTRLGRATAPSARLGPAEHRTDCLQGGGGLGPRYRSAVSIPIIGDGDIGFADGGANNRLGDYHRRGGYRVTIGRGEDRQNTSSVVTG